MSLTTATCTAVYVFLFPSELVGEDVYNLCIILICVYIVLSVKCQ